MMYWGGGQNQSDAVFHADLDPGAIDAATGDIVHPRTVPHEIDNGKWQTQIGNAGVYGKQNQWIITTTKNGEISIAYNDDFESRANLTIQSGVKAGTACGACLVPGYFGRKYPEAWGIVLVYRGYARDSKLYELSIFRDKSRYETVVDDLTDQLVQALKGKDAAEKERDQYKAAKDALEKKVDQLEKDKAAVEAERDKLKREEQQLHTQVAQLQGTITTLQGEIAGLKNEIASQGQVQMKLSACEAEVEQLRALFGHLRSTCGHSVSTLTIS
jgi:hypothetical protein